MEFRSVMNSANERYGSSLDRTQAPGKPVDPATRLSELLAQSLDELTRPFDPPRPGNAPARAAAARDEAPDVPAPPPEASPEPVAATPAEQQGRADDRALAELEAELFAAAK